MDFVTKTIDDVEYTDIVPERYRMNPETEELLYADELEDGMVVLTEEGRTDETQDHNRYLALTRNRWSTVTHLRSEDDGIYFVAVYSDGGKIIRQSQPTKGWLVKKDSIKVPKTPDNMQSFTDVVSKALRSLA